MSTPERDVPLTADVGDAMLRLARTAISDAVANGRELPGALSALSDLPGLEQRRGAFVSLHDSVDRTTPRLRGCIGSMETDRTLLDAIPALAVQAALEDPRFPAVLADELPGIVISISVLTARRPISVDDVNTLVPGRDGLRLEHDRQRSVFLPQVALEQGWSRERWLEELSLKAGLRRDAWRESKLSTFRAEHFTEAVPQGAKTRKY